MSIHIIEETSFLFHSIILGICITLVYDIIRIFRRVCPHMGFMTAIEDFGFWIFCGIEIFLLLYQKNEGALRWFSVAGAAIGMMIYKLTIGRFVVRIVSGVLLKIKKVLKKIIVFILKPVSIVWKKIRKGTKKAGSKRRKYQALIKKKLTVRIKEVKIMLCKR